MSVGGRHLAAAPPDGSGVEKVPEACEKGPGRMNSDELSREEREDEVCQISSQPHSAMPQFKKKSFWTCNRPSPPPFSY